MSSTVEVIPWASDVQGAGTRLTQVTLDTQLLWLMTPVQNPQVPQVVASNVAHVWTRLCIERNFGLLKAQFHFLQRSGGALMYRPEAVTQMFLACAMLHNMCLRYVPLAPDEDMPPPEEEDSLPAVAIQPRS
ncbi:putative nuclease HARBI1 isoform X1 [Ambystoma mexicanum]|uniref:putative nuclease HARBI1 isoform X1 n=1 Tax=Ambystoma mexicanum TaxID=8296 RepID=UPI0037E85F52